MQRRFQPYTVGALSRHANQAETNPVIVLTKADKIKPAEGLAMQEKTLKAISKRPAAFPAVALTSAEKGTGMPELRAEIMRTTGAEL